MHAISTPAVLFTFTCTYIHILCISIYIYIYIYRCTCTFTGTNIRMYINRTFLEVRSSQPLAQTICPNQSQSPKVIMRPPPVWRASCSRWCAGKVNLANLPVMYKTFKHFELGGYKCLSTAARFQSSTVVLGNSPTGKMTGDGGFLSRSNSIMCINLAHRDI